MIEQIKENIKVLIKNMNSFEERLKGETPIVLEWH